jgi:hypothetical protein
MRKVRKDSILHGLPMEQRAKVNGWLFDKNLTYAQVAEGCLKMFGVKVSRSSVGRYYERQMLERTGKASEGVGEWVSEKVSGWAREMCVGMLERSGKSHTEAAYQETLAWMTHWALEEMKWPVAEERDLKTVCRFMKILIAARSEKNDAEMVGVRRKRFQTKAAKECLKHLRAEFQV